MWDNNQCFIFYPIFEQLAKKTIQKDPIPSKFGQIPYKKESVIRRKDEQRKRMVVDHKSSGEITSDPWEKAIFWP